MRTAAFGVLAAYIRHPHYKQHVVSFLSQAHAAAPLLASFRELSQTLPMRLDARMIQHGVSALTRHPDDSSTSMPASDDPHRCAQALAGHICDIIAESSSTIPSIGRDGLVLRLLLYACCFGVDYSTDAIACRDRGEGKVQADTDDVRAVVVAASVHGRHNVVAKAGRALASLATSYHASEPLQPTRAILIAAMMSLSHRGIIAEHDGAEGACRRHVTAAGAVAASLALSLHATTAAVLGHLDLHVLLLPLLAQSDDSSRSSALLSSVVGRTLAMLLRRTRITAAFADALVPLVKLQSQHAVVDGLHPSSRARREGVTLLLASALDIPVLQRQLLREANLSELSTWFSAESLASSSGHLLLLAAARWPLLSRHLRRAGILAQLLQSASSIKWPAHAADSVRHAVSRIQFQHSMAGSASSLAGSSDLQVRRIMQLLQSLPNASPPAQVRLLHQLCIATLDRRVTIRIVEGGLQTILGALSKKSVMSMFSDDAAVRALLGLLVNVSAVAAASSIGQAAAVERTSIAHLVHVPIVRQALDFARESVTQRQEQFIIPSLALICNLLHHRLLPLSASASSSASSLSSPGQAALIGGVSSVACRLVRQGLGMVTYPHLQYGPLQTFFNNAPRLPRSLTRQLLMDSSRIAPARRIRLW